MTEVSAGIAVREWRTQRRISQLALAHQVGVSARHLSFVETGRANASRALLLRIGESLDLPLGARNRLLLAGGYAPFFGEHPLDAERMKPVKAALDTVLAGHAPYPAVVTDAGWNLVAANAGCLVLAEGITSEGLAPELLQPPVNVMKLCLHPQGLSQRLLNHAEVRSAILRRIRRHAQATAAPAVERLYEELASYPAPGTADTGTTEQNEVYVPFRLATPSGVELRFLNTVATFGSPLDIRVESLAVESFFPADATTSEYLHHFAAGDRMRALSEQYPALSSYFGSR